MNSRSDVILPHKKFTWADFGGINTDIHPVATPLYTNSLLVKTSVACSAAFRHVGASISITGTVPSLSYLILWVGKHAYRQQCSRQVLEVFLRSGLLLAISILQAWSMDSIAHSPATMSNELR